MDSSHLVNPELKAFLDVFPAITLSAESLQDIRAVMNSNFPIPEVPKDDPVLRTERLVPGPDGAPVLRLVICTPKLAKKALPAYYFIHGGGYVICGPDAVFVPLHEMADRLHCVVIGVDYRLAPDTRHPGPVEDCYAGLKWIFDHAEELGIDKTRIGVGGESAGGGLAAALALLARDRGQVSLAFQHLRCPMLDDRTCVNPDPHPYTGQYMWTHDHNEFGWQSLLGVPPGSTGVSAYAAPARAESLVGLPSTFISIGSLDLFLEESMDYARRLTRAGVPVEMHIYPGAFHGFEIKRDGELSIMAERDNNAALLRALNQHQG